MATRTPIDPVIKSEILQKVREEGLSVYRAAQIYNVNYRTIYGWIKKQIDGKDRNLILENNRLKKELDRVPISKKRALFVTINPPQRAANSPFLVVPAGLEPATQGSSGLCSTN